MKEYELYGRSRRRVVSAPDLETASGGVGTDKAEAFSWIAFIGLLIALRLVYEAGKKRG